MAFKQFSSFCKCKTRLQIISHCPLVRTHALIFKFMIASSGNVRAVDSFCFNTVKNELTYSKYVRQP